MMGTKWHSSQMADFSDRETFLQRERKRSERKLSNVIMPVASWGFCTNKYCESFRLEIELETGDGYCLSCFDKGAGRRGFKGNLRGGNE